MTDEVVTRLYRALVEELRRRAHPEGQPVTVSELYQTLVPYNAVRSALGVELNADYEDALLRLLSGERSLLRLEPTEAREELRREVQAPYPFVGLFRKFSASKVWVTLPDSQEEPWSEPEPEAVSEPEAAASVPPEPSTAPAASEPSIVRLRPGGGPEEAPARRAIQLHAPAETVQEERRLGTVTACAFCGTDLPSGRRARFCPHCGGDQRLRPCPSCEAVLERGWRYCISCGREAGGG